MCAPPCLRREDQEQVRKIFGKSDDILELSANCRSPARRKRYEDIKQTQSLSHARRTSVSSCRVSTVDVSALPCVRLLHDVAISVYMFELHIESLLACTTLHLLH